MDKIDFKTKIIFGKDAIDELPELLNKLNVKKVFLIYGGGSVKINGIFQKAISLLKKNRIFFTEFGGIEPNPRNTTINRAIEIGKKENIDFVLAIGGGSAIDASKIIAAGISNEWKDCWDFITNKSSLVKTPVMMGTVLTLSGTASENNAGSVVTNEITKEKFHNFTQAPVFAIEDPTYTFSVNKWQTASGSFDALSHLLEQFFGAKKFDFSDNHLIAMTKTIFSNTKKAIDNPTDYDARESLMITSSFALNGVLNFKNRGGDWLVHMLEHAMSAIWDITHGAGLATISYWYYELGINLNEDFKQRAEILAKELFNKTKAQDFVNELKNKIISWDLPTKLTSYELIPKVTSEDIKKIIKHTSFRGTLQLNDKQIEELIYKMI